MRKRPKFRGIPRLVLEKAEEKGKIPCLVSSSEKFYQSSTSSSLDDPSRTSGRGGVTNGDVLLFSNNEVILQSDGEADKKAKNLKSYSMYGP